MNVMHLLLTIWQAFGAFLIKIETELKVMVSGISTTKKFKNFLTSDIKLQQLN